MFVHQLQPGHTVAGRTIEAVHIGPVVVEVPGVGPVEAGSGECVVVYGPTAADLEAAEQAATVAGPMWERQADLARRQICETVVAMHDDVLPRELVESVRLLRLALSPPDVPVARSSSVFELNAEVA